IVVTPIVPSFELALADAQVSIPKGGTASVPFTLVRKEFNDAVTVMVVDPPAGLTVRPGLVAAGQLVGALPVSPAKDAALAATTLMVGGGGPEVAGSSPVEAHATKTIRFVEQEGIPVNSVTFRGLEAAPALATLVDLTTPAGPIEVAHGFGAS